MIAQDTPTTPAATLDIEDIPVATLRRFRNWAFPATLTDNKSPVRFLIDNLHDWVQPQAIHWYMKSEPQTYSLDKYVLSPTVKELKAFKAFILPSSVANDPTFNLENWEVWVNPTAFTQFKSTLTQPVESSPHVDSEAPTSFLLKTSTPDINPEEMVHKSPEEKPGDREQSTPARSRLKTMMKPKRRHRSSLPESDSSTKGKSDDKSDDVVEVPKTQPQKRIRLI
ncbi:hypothetical protein FRC03_003748 [Tulasnella sp. 419]|nr:hypothetical protein FRC03_003748 [Tulasnella sp. 419]